MALCGLVVILVDLALLRTMAVGIIRDAMSVLPLPSRVTWTVSPVLRVETGTA